MLILTYRSELTQLTEELRKLESPLSGELNRLRAILSEPPGEVA